MNRHILHLLILLCLLSSTVVSYAQGSIPKLIEQLETNPNCETTLYKEVRDPDSHKVVSSEMILTITSKPIADRLINAFKKERQNSVTYTVNNGGGNPSKDKKSACQYRIVFKNQKGHYWSYTLSYDPRRSKWTLMAKTSTGDNDSKKVTKKTSHKSTKKGIKKAAKKSASIQSRRWVTSISVDTLQPDNWNASVTVSDGDSIIERHVIVI